ncbi:unnamed protein product [Colias eurytheme]|nr:unnamed protein product [Colias eurytheme]
MIAFMKVGARQVVKWRDSQCRRVKYHSGVGVFGHRPAEVNDSEIPQEIISKRYENCRAQQLVNAYRTYGHLRATIDNVDYKKENR